MRPLHIGGTGGLTGGHESGAAAVGADYGASGLKTAVWGYQFYDLAKMAYALPGAGRPRPCVGARFRRETASGAVYLGPANAPCTAPCSGVKQGGDEPSLGDDDPPAHPGAFGNGDRVSPYTTGYAAGLLYTTLRTTFMIQDMIDRKTPGHTFKVTARGSGSSTGSA